MSDAEASADHRSPTLSSGRGRWKIGVGILLLAILAQGGFLARFYDDRTFSKMSILFVWPAALFALAVWWTWFSAQSWRTRLSVWAGIGAALSVFFCIFAFDAADGEMVPRLRYRWKPSAKQLAAAYLAGRPAPLPLPSDAVHPETDEPWGAVAGDWPGYRGPRRDGIVQGVKLRSDWQQRPLKEVWRHPVGLGWSSFAVAGDFAFTQEQRGPKECVVCYGVKDGTEVWVHADDAILSIVELNGDDGPHGTPEFHDGRVYTLGGTGLLNCLDARTGRCLWQNDILKDSGAEGQPTKNIEWGMSGSPLVVDDLVIVSPGSEHNRATIAYHRLTGKIVWGSDLYQGGYAAPRVETIHGVRQAVVFHGTGIAGHDLADGRLLWEFPWTNAPKVNAAQPIVFDDGSVLFGSGYGKGTARISLTPKADDLWETKLRWETSKFRPKFNDCVLKDGFVYGLDDGILACLNPEDGKLKWKDRAGHFGYGQLLLVDDVLLILSEAGELIQVRASPESFQEITRMKALDRVCWNHLAIAQGKLFVRNNHTAACFELD